MTSPSSGSSGEIGADPIDGSLEKGLHRPPLSEEAFERIRAVVHAEWQLVASRSRYARLTRRFRQIAAVCAAAAAAVVLLGVSTSWWQPESAAIMGSIARVERGGLEIRSGLFTTRTLGTGSSLHVGQVAHANGSALVVLTDGATLRIAAGAVIAALESNRIELRSGRMYLDFPPATLGAERFTVQTKAGFVEHYGTQFEVTIDRDVRVRVREGVVRFHRPSGVETAEAGIELVVPVEGPVERHPLATHGRQWSWMEALAPEYEIEDRSLIDFLQWVARETGRQLDFADDTARAVAARTRLHGSVEGLAPLEALTRVLRTTTLSVELRGDDILISSSP